MPTTPDRLRPGLIGDTKTIQAELERAQGYTTWLRKLLRLALEQERRPDQMDWLRQALEEEPVHA